jgi:hypothetical protein
LERNASEGSYTRKSNSRKNALKTDNHKTLQLAVQIVKNYGGRNDSYFEQIIVLFDPMAVTMK